MKTMPYKKCGAYFGAAVVLSLLALLWANSRYSADLLGWINANQGLAGWVQGVGSIVAIVSGAIAIRWQVGAEARREEQARIARVQLIANALFQCRRCVTCFAEHAATHRDADLHGTEALWWLGSLANISILDFPSHGAQTSVGFAVAERGKLEREIEDFNARKPSDFPTPVARSIAASLLQAEIAVESHLKRWGAFSPANAFEVDGKSFFPAGRSDPGPVPEGSTRVQLDRRLPS